MAVIVVVSVTYVVLKRKYQRDYSHRKLIEDYPTEPGNFTPFQSTINVDSCKNNFHVFLCDGRTATDHTDAARVDEFEIFK